MDYSISIIGCGSWGTAIAQALARQGYEVMIYSRRSEQVRHIREKRVNSDYFPEIVLSKNIAATDDLKKALRVAEYIFISVPTSATAGLMAEIEDNIPSESTIISTAKGIDVESFKTNSELIAEYAENPLAVLSGPTHAEEVIKELPSAAVIASHSRKVAEDLQELISDRRFRIYTNQDVRGVELGGAIKNIIALAAGISDGLGYGDNARAALITRGLAEIARLGEELGAATLTFSGLTGLGDLVVTCNSTHSRNRTFGYKIGEGKDKKTALKEVGQAVEGIKSTEAVYRQKVRGNISAEMPITEEIYSVLFEGKDPLTAVDELMTRDPKTELGSR